MTVDDENSIYVGGLPYECTESQLRRAFELYGSIIAVKIINDRDVGGKCYGFVTFTNPRSATEAINEMDGRNIGGRVVRVNEVKTRGSSGRYNYGPDNFRRNDRDMDGEKGRGRRENDHDKDKHRNNSREHVGKRERGYENIHDHDHALDQFQGRDRGQSRDLEEWEHGVSRNRDKEWERDDGLIATRDRQFDRADDHDRRGDKSKDRHAQRKNSSSSYDQQSREVSSESSDYYHQVGEQLHLLTARREKLHTEKSDMEQKLEEQKQLIVDLQKKSLKLEDGLASTKKLSAMRQMQLTKLYRCFQQVKEYGERLKSSEKELQDLVNALCMEIDTDGDFGVRDVYLANGKD